MKYIVSFYFFLMANLLLAQSDKIIVEESDSIRIEYRLLPQTDSVYERRMFKHDILIEQLHVQYKIRVGEYMEYYDDGTLLGMGEFNSKGESIGIWKAFHPNGRLSNKRSYENGGLKGEAIFYYSDGNIKAKGSYHSDMHQYIVSGYSMESLSESKVGQWIYFYPNGQMKSKGEYWFKKPVTNSPENRKDDVLEDEESFSDDLEIGEYARIWKKDLKNGEWLQWNKYGEATKMEVYNKGELVEIIPIVNNAQRP
jgi:antitoxin component YwqK of YwqJK toxin-antitoxin module